MQEIKSIYSPQLSSPIENLFLVSLVVARQIIGSNDILPKLDVRHILFLPQYKILNYLTGFLGRYMHKQHPDRVRRFHNITCPKTHNMLLLYGTMMQMFQ